MCNQSDTVIALAMGVQILSRGPHALQFGLDATRSGIIEVGDARAVAAVLDSLSTPRPLPEVVRRLAVSMDADAARSLIQDLIAYRVLVEVSRPEVLLIGTSTLANTLVETLRASGIHVRSPEPTQPLSRFLFDAPSPLPLIIVDQAHRTRALAAYTRHRTGPVLPVLQIDTRVLIGPYAVGVEGPCLICREHYLLERDPQWAAIAAAAPAGVRNPDPVVIQAGVAAAATMTRRICQLPDPPGVAAPDPRTGDTLLVDPFNRTPLKTLRLQPHPDCPLCF
ncbi:hypothetical protein ACXIUA_03075 [Corynebacterium sp. UMB8791]